MAEDDTITMSPLLKHPVLRRGPERWLAGVARTLQRSGLRRSTARPGSRIALAALLGLAGCHHAPLGDDNVPSSAFPAPARPVAPIISAGWSNEDARDKAGEANAVMREAGIRRGMTVADIGAGEGYYTVRLAARVGASGRVLAEDVVSQVRDALADRVARERLDNVSVRLGLPADPRLPRGSFDRIMLVHMYHEIASPYEFLWRIWPALKSGGRIVVVDADRPTLAHGTPPALLACEFAAIGYVRVAQVPMPSAGGYLAMFAAQNPRTDPKAIQRCGEDGRILPAG